MLWRLYLVPLAKTKALSLFKEHHTKKEIRELEEYQRHHQGALPNLKTLMAKVPVKFPMGAKVKIMMPGPDAGRFAVVADPDCQGMVKVVMKGATNEVCNFKAEDLQLVAKTSASPTPSLGASAKPRSWKSFSPQMLSNSLASAAD